MDLSVLSGLLKECGVAGAGGAGFPSYAKLSRRADTIILNCAECEPLFKVHRQVLERYAFEILSALNEVADAVQAEKIMIAVKKAYTGAISAVQALLPSFPRAEIRYLPEVYPAGDEVVTVYQTTGRVVPPGDIPLSVGVTVFNVETALNIYEAVHHHKPVTEKYVMVAGAVSSPITVKAPLGISAKELVAMAGGPTLPDAVYISGGPMTGNIVSPYDVVTKTTNAYLVMPKDHYIVRKRLIKPSVSLKRAMSACCHCRMCTDLCPRSLLGHPIQPHAFMQAASSGCTEKVKPFLDTMFCSQCGICEMYACFQDLSPRSLIGAYKAGLRKNGVTVPKPSAQAVVNPERDYRMIPVSRLTARLGLREYDLPAPLSDTAPQGSEIKVHLRQHIGASAVAEVQKGDKVKYGQRLGNIAEDALGLPVHSPIDGTVMDVSNEYILIRK